jgi:PncC family amidohydrolase
MLTERNFTVATAESATAGDLGARLARIPGASKVLAGGHIVYSDAAKLKVGGIDRDLLARHGSVSAEVTAALATAARDQFGATFGIAVTGVAGPGPHNGVAAGTCYWALAMPDGSVEVAGRQSPGERSQIQLRLGTTALDLLRQRISRFS